MDGRIMAEKTIDDTLNPDGIKLPEDFEDAEEFLSFIRETRHEDADADEENRERGFEDLEFAGGFQWDQRDLEWRRENRIPTLTINRFPAFLQQRIGARMRSRVGPRIDPETPGEKYENVAKIRQGLVRGIERFSRAHVAYDRAYQNILMAGVGNFYIRVDYATDDVFEHDIRVEQIFNPFSVVWDRLSRDSTGKDARHCFVERFLPKKEFEALYPDATPVDDVDVLETAPFRDRPGLTRRFISDWIMTDAVRVVHFWRMRVRQKKLALMTDGDVIDVTEIPDPQNYTRQTEEGEVISVVRHPQTGQPMVRNSPSKYAELYITNGVEVLDGPFELPINRLPVIRATGWLVPIGDDLQRYSMISFGKDPMRFHNYVRSDRAERIVNKPRALWKATEEQISGHETKWNNSHLNRNRVLIYNGSAGGSPEQVEPPVVDNAAVLESQASINDIMDVFNMHEAALGQTSNEVSRVAIDARSGISELGAVIFDENMNYAQQEGYDVINQLIPYVYDTPRLIKIMGEDDTLRDAMINDPENPESADIAAGKYSVALEIGPSYASRRMHAVESMRNIINSVPDAASIVFDKLIEAEGIPGGDIIADRWRKRFGLSDDDSKKTPEQMAAEAEQAEMQQAEQMAKIQAMQLDLEQKQADAEKAKADAEKARADADKARAEVDKIVAQESELITRAGEHEARTDLYDAQTVKTIAEADRVAREPVQNPNKENE